MSHTGVKAAFMTLYIAVFLTDLAAGSNLIYPKAQNVSWSSVNFKTLLMWDPKPINYSYTVEFSVVGNDRERNPHCIRATETECDLSNYLTNLKATYSADVLSEAPRGVISDLIEFPHTRSERFCPYKDTQIGRPDFRYLVSKDTRKITLYVTDPLTAVLKDDRIQSIRDVFADELQYKVTYRKAASTGKKIKTSKTSEIELTDIDRGESYCFQVQAYLPSRSYDKQLGELSHTQCSPDEDKSFFDEYGIGVIASGFLAILVVIAAVIAVTVVCCRRRRRANQDGKEGVPLRSVS